MHRWPRTNLRSPPGSGKTKTIVAIVGALLSQKLNSDPGTGSKKKLLVCAPSNAAVDELVMRFKSGVTTLNRKHHDINVVRLGRSDAINANVKDVTMEEMVKQYMQSRKFRIETDDTKKTFADHQSVSKRLREAHAQLGGQAGGELPTPEVEAELKTEIRNLLRQKTDLGSKIDKIKDSEKEIGRREDLARKEAMGKILSGAHIICATLSGSGHDMLQNFNVEFESVVVDEAAQCVEVSALIPLKYGCTKCILVGDPKQLPPTVFSQEAARFQYEQSLFVRMQRNHPQDIHLLDTQYRMHPEISVFPSKTFYDGRLLDGGDMRRMRQRPWHRSRLFAPFMFYDVQGRHDYAGHSLVNHNEVHLALCLYQRLTEDYAEHDWNGKIGIITPYKSQLHALKTRFIQEFDRNIVDQVEFNTTDAFQGREAEIIIFSCVRASPSGGIGFLRDIRRMNVGLTRAKCSLWVLGNSQSLARGQYWKQLVDQAKARNRFLEGNLTGMLQRHSDAFPAAPEDMPVRGKAASFDVGGSRRGSVADSSPESRPSSSASAKSFMSGVSAMHASFGSPPKDLQLSSPRKLDPLPANGDSRRSSIDTSALTSNILGDAKRRPSVDVSDVEMVDAATYRAGGRKRKLSDATLPDIEMADAPPPPKKCDPSAAPALPAALPDDHDASQPKRESSPQPAAPPPNGPRKVVRRRKPNVFMPPPRRLPAKN